MSGGSGYTPKSFPSSVPEPFPLKNVPTTTLLRSARKGDPSAASDLVPVVYEELRALAAAYLRNERLGHTLQPTALVNEAYLRLIDRRSAQTGDREHFLAIASQTMRRVLVDHSRKRAALKRGGAEGYRVTLNTGILDSSSNELDIVELDDLLERLGKMDERAARVVELRFFGGLGVDDIAGVLGVSDRTVDNDWYFARGWISRELHEAREN